eukprot:m.12319 g.12319  ORF g.12319 m.12319 type:complete len:805 (-) comp9701_c0_seq1:994-3408(-)
MSSMQNMKSVLWADRLNVVEAPTTSPIACGDKIILPARVVESLGERAFNTSAPLLIRIAARKTGGQFCFGTVLEFASEANTAVLPAWMLKHLGVIGGGQVEIAILSEELPKATFVSLQPLDPHFFSFKDFRAVLESAIGSRYATLMKGTTIMINHFGEPFSVTVKDLAPDDACSIVDTEVEVDLVPPLDADGKPIVIPSGSVAHKKMHADAMSGEQTQRIDISVTDAAPSHVTIPTNVPDGTPPPVVLFVAPSNVIIRVTVETASSQGGVIGQTSVPCADVEVYLKEFTADSEGFPNKLDHDLTCNEGSYEGGAVIAVPAREVETKYVLAVFPSKECTEACTTGSASSFPVTVRVTAIPTAEADTATGQSPLQETNALPDAVQCANCKEHIPRARLALHSAYCERHNVRCDACGRVLRKALQAQHWHCDQCVDHPFAADTQSARIKHERLFHTDVACSCGLQLSLRAIPTHARTACPDRRMVCRFCGNAMRAGAPASDAVDRIRGYTAHEAVCGGKTVLCHQCHVSVRQRDLDVHARLHALDPVGTATSATAPRVDIPRAPVSTIARGGVSDAQREAAWARAGFGPAASSHVRGAVHPPRTAHAPAATPRVEHFPPGFLDPVPKTVHHPPDLCAAVGCMCAAGRHALGLCAACAAQLGSNGDAVLGPALLKQLVKVLYQQLTQGCGRHGCPNPHCATARTAPPTGEGGRAEAAPPTTTAAAAAAALQLAKSAANGNGVPLCLGEHQRKYADTVAHISSMGFPAAWCVLALDQTGDDVQGAVMWLLSNAPQPPSPVRDTATTVSQ